MRRIKATIFYKMDENHPDKDYVIGGLVPDQEMSFTDTYDINPDNFWGEDHIRQHIKDDLRLVAGGGYNSDHIYQVRFEMEEVA